MKAVKVIQKYDNEMTLTPRATQRKWPTSIESDAIAYYFSWECCILNYMYIVYEVNLMDYSDASQCTVIWIRQIGGCIVKISNGSLVKKDAKEGLCGICYAVKNEVYVSVYLTVEEKYNMIV